MFANDNAYITLLCCSSSLLFKATIYFDTVAICPKKNREKNNKETETVDKK